MCKSSAPDKHLSQGLKTPRFFMREFYVFSRKVPREFTALLCLQKALSRNRAYVICRCVGLHAMYCHTVCHTHTFELAGMDHKIDKITMFRSYLGQTQYISFTTRLLVAIQVQGCTCTEISGYYAAETPLLV